MPDSNTWRYLEELEPHAHGNTTLLAFIELVRREVLLQIYADMPSS